MARTTPIIRGYGMLSDANPELVETWDQIPTNATWTSLHPPCVIATNYYVGASGWPHMTGGQRHWKVCMIDRATQFATLARAFGVEPFCGICDKGEKYADFAAHVCSQVHYNEMYSRIDSWQELAKDESWHDTLVVGGWLRFNLLDGEVNVLRTEMPEKMLPHAVVPRDIPIPSEWFTVHPIACAATQLVRTRPHWPNMWSLRHWKQKMYRSVEKLGNIIEKNGGLMQCFCQYCKDQLATPDHLLGPAHFQRLTSLLPSDHPLEGLEYLQTWTLGDQRCCITFGHLDGQVLMARAPHSDGSDNMALEGPAFHPAGSAAGPRDTAASANGHCQRVAAPPSQDPSQGGATSAGRDQTSRVACSPGPPPGPPSCSASRAAPPAPSGDGSVRPPVPGPCHLTETLSGGPPPKEGLRRVTTTPCAEQDPRPPIACDAGEALSFNLARLMKQTVRSANALSQKLDEAGVPWCERRCQLCNCSFVEDVSTHFTSASHLDKVQELFDKCGDADHDAWLQSWHGVKFNHLTMSVTADPYGGRPPPPESPANSAQQSHTSGISTSTPVSLGASQYSGDEGWVQYFDTEPPHTPYWWNEALQEISMTDPAGMA